MPSAPKIRRYLVENLRSGVLDSLSLAVALGSRELADATAGGRSLMPR
jgi:hypothetical protein